ncbi:MAG: ATP synthase F1 subunit gamma [Candidatus Gracilibacteria bacterium]|nr:ATP synthase F1 subunit gamma [Candidatus Gracilibacteria bacterium]
MAGAKEIRRKISSIKNTGKITKAMELISTVKMKKAQDSVMAKKEIVLEILKVFARIEDSLSGYPLFDNGLGDKTLAVVITSNKGLCGGYNIGVMKKINSYIKETNEVIDFITVGKKAANFVSKTGNNLIADFSKDFTDNIKPIYTKRISRLLKDEFMSGAYKKVVVFYSHYINTIKQIPVNKDFLPISSVDIKNYLSEIIEDSYDIELELKADIESQNDYKIEPSKEELAEHIIPIILDMMFYDLLLESKASEHSSRMIAMKNAKDNAAKIAGNLTLKYNKARQAIITKEVSEITSGVESLKD